MSRFEVTLGGHFRRGEQRQDSGQHNQPRKLDTRRPADERVTQHEEFVVSVYHRPTLRSGLHGAVLG